MEKGEYIGKFINRWRQRTVLVYRHPSDATLLVTVGQPFGGGSVVECVESLADYSATLAKIADAETHGGVYRYE